MDVPLHLYDLKEAVSGFTTHVNSIEFFIFHGLVVGKTVCPPGAVQFFFLKVFFLTDRKYPQPCAGFRKNVKKLTRFPNRWRCTHKYFRITIPESRFLNPEFRHEPAINVPVSLCFEHSTRKDVPERPELSHNYWTCEFFASSIQKWTEKFY